MKSTLVLPVLVMLAGCRSAPPPQPSVTKDLRPEIDGAFRQHNSQTTDALRNLANSYETGIRAYQQKHPVALSSDKSLKCDKTRSDEK